ncbi:transposase [Pseudomonas sp. 3A(2025)]
MGQLGQAHRVIVQITASGAIKTVSLESVEFIKAVNERDIPIENNKKLVMFDEATDAQYLEAKRRFDIIKTWRSGLLSASEAALKIGVVQSYFYKLSKLYDGAVGAYSLLPKKRGRKEGTSFIDQRVEKVVVQAVKSYRGKAATFSKVYREVESLCIEQRLLLPARGTVTARIKSIMSREELYRAKEGGEAARQKYGSRRGKHKSSAPLARVQMDHTLVDVMLLSNDRLRVIGRPWLTVAIDIYTRAILGYYLSLHVPSALSVACTLTHAVFHKKDYLRRLGLDDIDYPFYGVPLELQMDNAAEFTSGKFIRACDGVGIKHELRPLGRKHYGGHVERLIGTFMNSKVHLLKGTTMSNAVARRGAESEKNATLTFSDFSIWFAREVAEYHATVHSVTGKSPRQIWEKYFTSTDAQPFRKIVEDPFQFKLRFMPEDRRMIQPDGIHLFCKTYWDPVLKPFYGMKNVQIKFDPFSMRQIWVKVDNRYCKVGYSDLTEKDFTYEEYRASRFFSSPVRAGTLDDPSAVSIRRENLRLTKKASVKKRSALRRQESKDAYDKYQNLEPEIVSTSLREKIDYSLPPIPFKPGTD